MRRALIAVLLSVLVAPAAAGAAVPRDFFGVMANGPLDAPTFDLAAESAQMRASGVGSERMEISWDLAEPDRGRFELAPYDRKVLAAATAGIDVLALVVRSPSWAAVQPGKPFSPPKDPATYAAFMKAMVARYGPQGSLWAEHPEVPRRPVRSWQIWNEPNIVNYWSVQPFMKGYARLLNSAYAAVKGADRGATVVMAGFANFSWRDVSRLMKSAHRRLRFDVAAVHPFSGRPSNSVKIVRLNREVLDRNGFSRRPIWLTELTWSSAKGRKTPITKDWETTESGQATRLTQAYAGFIRARRSLRLERIYWYTWITVDRDSPNSFDYSGLRTLKADGSVADKPAARAFRGVVKKYG
jgi:hypothetical protein